jgi:hypothetical protein
VRAAEHMPSGYRPPAPQLPEPGSRAGLPPLVLLAMIRAESRWPDRAADVEAALAWEPPISTPRPLIEIPRHEIVAGIGAWSRKLDAERLARRAAAGTASEAPEKTRTEPAGEQNDPAPYDDAPSLVTDKDGPQNVSAHCQVCGGEFRARRRDAKACSPKCRQRASRRAAA